MNSTRNTRVAPPQENSPQSAAAATSIRLLSGELLIYTPPNMAGARRRPMVTLGSFRNRVPAIHFRTYEQKKPGAYRVTHDGASFGFQEFWEIIVPRLDDLCDERPELVEYEQRKSEGGR